MKRRGMQKWFSIRQYTHDFLELVYRYYAEAGISYVCTYWSLNLPMSVADTEILDGLTYETTGELSGLLWDKILFFPVYNVETVQNTFVADERGMGKFDQVTSFNFPTEYGIKPRIHDFVMFEEPILRDEHEQEYKLKSITEYYRNTKPPIYQVNHFEKATNTDTTFWKVNLKIGYQNAHQLDQQLSGHFTYFDLEKKIFETEDANFMFKMMEKNRKLDGNDFWRQHCGFYFI